MPALSKLQHQLNCSERVVITFSFLNSGKSASLESNFNSKTIWVYTNNYNRPKSAKEALELLKDYHKGTPDLLSISLRTTKPGIPNAQLKTLAMEAICQVWGIKCPDEAGLKEMKKARTAEQKEIRNKHLSFLTNGQTDQFNALQDSQHENAGSYRNAELAGLKAPNTDFGGLDFQKANFENADLSKSNLSRMQLKEANFKKAKLTSCNAHAMKAIEANFEGADLKSIKMRNANLSRSSMQNANLTKADLSASNLCGTDFSGAVLKDIDLSACIYDNETKFDSGFIPPIEMVWKGTGPAPSAVKRREARDSSGMSIEDFMKALEDNVDQSRLSKALSMLKKSSFELYAQVDDEDLVGVIKSQSDPDLVYSCRLNHEGQFCCCTQNLNACGGLRGKLCKHLLVLVIGLAKNGEIEASKIFEWVDNSRDFKPELDGDAMSEVLLRYKGAEAGEIDWRPSETVPEDYYIF